MKTTFNRSASSRLGRYSAWVLLGFLAVVAQPCSGAIKNITISGTAAPLYVRPLDPQGKPRPESYIFSQGKCFGGNMKDPQLAKFRFDDILKMLAVNLAKQNYFPTRDVPAANLVLIVHWGDTTIYEDPNKEFAADNVNAALSAYNDQAAANNGHADPGALNGALNEQANMESSAQAAIARNATILGYKNSLVKEREKIFSSPEEETMMLELSEERYFVIVMAYDYQYMKKEHKPRLLWVTRMSVRSPGNNFNEAMPALAEAGADVFGHELKGLARVDAPEHGGHVDYGELKVMGTVEDHPPQEKKK